MEGDWHILRGKLFQDVWGRMKEGIKLCGSKGVFRAIGLWKNARSWRAFRKKCGQKPWQGLIYGIF